MADKTKELIECGKAFGYEGEDLLNYVESERAKLEKKAIEDFERAERLAERELKKMEFEREERERARAHELKLQELKKTA